jgi:hypothetical protein
VTNRQIYRYVQADRIIMKIEVKWLLAVCMLWLLPKDTVIIKRLGNPTLEVTFTQENSKTCNIIIVDCSIMAVNVNCNRLS